MIERPLYLNQLKTFQDTDLVKVLVGIRRAGKSTVLDLMEEHLLKSGVKPEKIIHINFEKAAYADIRTKSEFLSLAKKLIKEKRRYFLLDEVQNVDGWDEVVNAIRAEKDTDVYITGSNSKLLARELSTYLTGRFVNIYVSTLNFAEYLSFRQGAGLKKKLSGRDLADEFDRFTKYGGFPVLHTRDYTLSEADSVVYDIYSSIVFNDLIERHNIRNSELLMRVTKFVFDNIGNTFSAKSISDFLKSEHRSLDIETIYNYLTWLEEVFVISRVARYDIRGKERLRFQEKFYLGDVGLLYALNDHSETYSSGVLENIVYNELLSRGYEVYIGKNGDKEIDFVAEKNHERIYLQVCEHLYDKATIEREYGAFAGIKDNYPKYVLTLDDKVWNSEDGIIHAYLPRFLLESL